MLGTLPALHVIMTVVVVMTLSSNLSHLGSRGCALPASKSHTISWGREGASNPAVCRARQGGWVSELSQGIALQWRMQAHLKGEAIACLFISVHRVSSRCQVLFRHRTQQ